MSYLIAVGLIMTLAGSLFIAVTSTEQQNTVGKRFPWISVVFIVMFLFVLGIVPMVQFLAATAARYLGSRTIGTLFGTEWAAAFWRQCLL